jgi:hypothetical protein
LLVFTMASTGAMGAVTTTVVDVPTRATTQRFLYVHPDAPVANIVNLIGGDGLLGIQLDGTMTNLSAPCNPVIRNRQALAEHGYALALVDATADGSVWYFNDVLEVVRYMQGRDNFLTHIANEIAILDAGVTIKGWARTGQLFNVYPVAGSATSPVCRFYIPPALGDSHFYGRGTAECDATGSNNPSFINEDPQFFHLALPTAGVCPSGMRAVYRVFSNRLDANHRYMVSQSLRDQMAGKGWLLEGDGPDLVVMCSP